MTRMCEHCATDYGQGDCPKCGSSEVECGNCEAVITVDVNGKPHAESTGDDGKVADFFAPGTPAQAVWCGGCLDNYDGAPDDVADLDAGPSLDEQCDAAWKAKRG